MNKFLTSIDLFGEPVKVYINKKAKINTPFGGILSLIMFIIIIILSWFIGKDIVIKENPFSYEQKLASKDYPKLELNETTFPIAISILDFNSIPIMDDRYIQFKLFYTLTQSNGDNIMETEYLQSFHLEKCEYHHFPKLTHDQFNFSQMENNLCFNNQNFTLKGFWGENKIQYLNFVVEMCDYHTYPDYCKSHDEIVKYLAEFRANFNIFYVDTAVDIKKFKNSFNYYVNSIYTYLDGNTNKILEYFLDYQSLVTDNGFVFEDKQTENYFKLEEILKDSIDLNNKKKTLLNFIIYSGNKNSFINRKYIKVTEILASVGGLIKIIHLVFTIGNLGFSRVKKFETVINHVFDFNLNSNCNNDNEKFLNYKSQNKDNLKSGSNKVEKVKFVNNFDFNPKSKNINLITPHINKSVTNSNSTESMLGNFKIKKAKSSLELSFTEVLYILFKSCCRRKLKHNKKFQTFLIGERKIIEYFDFVNIIIHLEEFEALKKIIFNDNQRIIFGLNINPNLNEERKNYIKNISKNSPQIIDRHIKEYLCRIKSGKTSEIDDNLLKYLLNVD